MRTLLALVLVFSLIPLCLLPTADAQSRLGPGEGEAEESTENESSTNSTESEPSNESVPEPSTEAPPEMAPPPAPPASNDAVGTGFRQTGSFMTDVCVKSFKNINRPYECAWRNNQKIHDRFWVLATANHPFSYRIYLDEQLVADGTATWRIEWNTTTSKSKLDIRIVLKDLSVVEGHEVEYRYMEMGVRATGYGADEEEEGEGDGPGKIEVDPDALSWESTLAIIGSTLSVGLGMWMAYYHWQGKDENQGMTAILGGNMG